MPSNIIRNERVTWEKLWSNSSRGKEWLGLNPCNRKKSFENVHKHNFHIFGCESSPISRNVRTSVSESVSQLMQNKAKYG